MRFTIYHGLAASLVLHSLLGLPFIAYSLAAAPEDELLTLDLQSDVADTQTEQQVMQQTKAAEQKEQVAKPEPPPPEPPPVEDGGTPAPAPTPVVSPSVTQPGDTRNVKGVNEQQDAHRIKVTEKELINAYTRLLGKKVGSHLPHPEGRASAAVVSFTVLADGQVRSLRVAESSGQAALDAGALKAIRESAPFDPPPRELNLAITLDFKKH